MTTYFDKQNSICSDSCWEESKKYGNQKINDYQTYSTQLVDCIEPNVRLPEFMYDHVNLRGRPGYGLADSCLIDNYSSLINNKDVLTRDRCKLQLFRRLLFQNLVEAFDVFQKDRFQIRFLQYYLDLREAFFQLNQ